MRRRLVFASTLLSAVAALWSTAAGAQGYAGPSGGDAGAMGYGREPSANHASNMGADDTRSVIAPRLPTPPPGENIRQLLITARQALAAGRTGAAQEALERAETRVLDRSVPIGEQNVPDQDPLVAALMQARQALGNGRPQQAVAIIDSAVPEAASAPPYVGR